MSLWLRYIIFILLFPVSVSPLGALDFEKIETAYEDGSPLIFDKIKILSVVRFHAASKNTLPLFELSGLAWSEDENILYAVSDHGALFQLRPEFDGQSISDIKLLDAYQLKDKFGNDLGYPWSDSEGLYLADGDNGKMGDDKLLVSFELKPRLQWHLPDGGFISKENLPEWLEDEKNYYKRSHALESVTMHPKLGVVTTPEYPLNIADLQSLTLYQTNGDRFEVPRVVRKSMAVCAIETMPDGDFLILKRRFSMLPPIWSIELDRLSIQETGSLVRRGVATMKMQNDFPLDNFEGLTRHKGNRYFMVSDNNEHFMQHTYLVYFELMP